MSNKTTVIKMVGVNHDVYVKDSTKNIVINRIQALLHVSSRYDPETINVTGNSIALPWISSGNYPVLISRFFPMWSRADLGLQFSNDTLIKK
jgi:hypothetical protein